MTLIPIAASLSSNSLPALTGRLSPRAEDILPQIELHRLTSLYSRLVISRTRTSSSVTRSASTRLPRSNQYILQRVRAMQSAVTAGAILSVHLSVRLSVRHIEVFCPDDGKYDLAVFSFWQDNPSSFWRGKAYRDFSQAITQRWR